MGDRPLKVVYAFDNRVPSAGADTEQLVSTVAALSRRDVETSLLLPRLGPPADGEAVRRFYDVDGRFDVGRYPTVARPRVAQKWWSGARVALDRRVAGADLLYTRNLPIAVGGVSWGHRVVFESYRPWPDQYPVLRPMIRRLMGSPRFVGAVLHSEVARSSYERAGVAPGKLLVAHNGYDPQRMEPVLDRPGARERCGLPPDRPLVVYTGRIGADKGLDAVLEMARRAPDVLFLLVGAREEDPFEATAEAVSNVQLVPWQPYDTVSDWLYAADVLLVPPTAAPLERHGRTVLPMKIFSYLAAGRPVLAGASADVAEVLTHEVDGLLVPPGDTGAAVRALRRLLDEPALWRRLADGARETAKGLTWDARAERIHGFLVRRLAETDGRGGGGGSGGKDRASPEPLARPTARRE